MSYLAAGPVTAAQLEALVPVIKKKTANETVNNSSTLQNDDHLLWTLAASTSYTLELYLAYSSGTTPDFKFTWVVPSGTTYRWGGTYYDVSGTHVSNAGFSEVTVGAIGGTGAIVRGTFQFEITTSTTAGTLQLQWAQNAANASDTIVYAGSYGRLTQIVTV